MVEEESECKTPQKAKKRVKDEQKFKLGYCDEFKYKSSFGELGHYLSILSVKWYIHQTKIVKFVVCMS